MEVFLHRLLRVLLITDFMFLWFTLQLQRVLLGIMHRTFF